MRKLTTIRRIGDIFPIPGADAIEALYIDGWVCVAKKGEFKVGDFCLYFEIDSILPKENTMFGFLMNRSCKTYSTETGVLEGHRLRTIKLRGQLSQGLAMPIPDWMVQVGEGEESIWQVWSEDGEACGYATLDSDVSWAFGVEKYEPIVNPAFAGMIRGNYPSWLPKTDQERVQNLKPRHRDGLFAMEEKLEGSSMSITFDPDIGPGVTSRNCDLKLDQEGNAFVDFALKSGILEKLEKFGEVHGFKRFAIRGELVGPGIQGNIYELTHNRFYMFDLYVDGVGYLVPNERSRLLSDLEDGESRVFQVPLLDSACRLSEDTSVNDILERADGYSMINVRVLREGIVFKNIIDGNNHWKAVSNQYLLKNGD